MTNTYVAINTEIGLLKGRDCIFLDDVSIKDGTNTLVLKGEITGSLCSKGRPGEDMSFTLKFTGVLALKMIELDSWDWKGESAFDEVLDSEWIRLLGGKVTPEHRHFQIQTYDDVFEVACSAYEFRVVGPAMR